MQVLSWKQQQARLQVEHMAEHPMSSVQGRTPSQWLEQQHGTIALDHRWS